MAYSTIILDKAEGIATLTLNRPKKLNALNETMAAELLDAFKQVEQDNDVSRDFPFQLAMKDQDPSSLLSPIIYPWYLAVNIHLGALQ